MLDRACCLMVPICLPSRGEEIEDKEVIIQELEVLAEKKAEEATMRKRKLVEEPSSPSRPGPHRAKRETSSEAFSNMKPLKETKRTREGEAQQEYQDTPASDATDGQEQAFNVTVRSGRHGTCQGSHVAQACVGHCESSAFPSRHSVLVASGYRHNITSVSQCCTISSLKKVRGLGLMGAQRWGPRMGRNRNKLGFLLQQVKVWLSCMGNQRGELEIFTARACQCDMCRLSRY
ncbi:glycoprotein hormone alpha 2 [Cricetulus griseus]